MVRTGVRRWKHFECLTMAEMDALGPGAKERFDEWLVDRRTGQRWEKILAAGQTSSLG